MSKPGLSLNCSNLEVFSKILLTLTMVLSPSVELLLSICPLSLYFNVCVCVSEWCVCSNQGHALAESSRVYKVN